LFIATCLVGAGACGAVYAVQKFMGVDNVQDFARRMRYWTNAYLSGIVMRIYRGPEKAEEREVGHDLALVDELENWTQEEAEKRIMRAYEEGGWSLLSKVLWRELEAEARVERAKRQREIDTRTSRNS